MSAIKPESLGAVLATDCGSTTTKAILFEKTKDGWRATYRGEAPTTVEKPVQDVTIGARNAFSELEDLSGRKLLKDTSPEDSPIAIRKNNSDPNGVDLYVSTSSAGGGLQMVVLGVVGTMSAESAERAALGAGAIVMDAISLNDGREPHERVEKIRHLRPDIVLIAGGTEGGTVDHPLELAETLLQADPRPRFGDTLRIPVIYAANSAARAPAREILEKRFTFEPVANIRPTLEAENLGPARDTIHELFLNHVMSHAPGYRKLLSWSPVPILPTPAAFGEMTQCAAKKLNVQVLAVDIGGATTDVFSVFKGSDGTPVFNRTVSANLGMSYSIGNVLIEAGERNILRWLPFSLPEGELRDRIRNKMIRPTTIPQSLEDLHVEQAVCREALRLALDHHRRLAVGLSGVKTRKGFGDLFRSGATSKSLVSMMALDLIIGSGGVLSHAPDRAQAAFMMIDAYQPEGVTHLAVDSVFMMPHLGVLSTVHPAAATEILFRDCLVELGPVIAPTGIPERAFNHAQPILSIDLGGRSSTLAAGELRRESLESGVTVRAKLRPLLPTVDVGAGPGRERDIDLRGGAAGLFLDARGRPIVHPRDPSGVKCWYESLRVRS